MIRRLVAFSLLYAGAWVHIFVLAVFAIGFLVLLTTQG